MLLISGSSQVRTGCGCYGAYFPTGSKIKHLLLTSQRLGHLQRENFLPKQIRTLPVEFQMLRFGFEKLGYKRKAISKNSQARHK